MNTEILCLSDIVTVSQLSVAELSAARLDGDVFALDGVFASVAVPETAQLRAAALLPGIPPRTIVELRTALWVYGASARAPLRPDVCVDLHGGIRIAPSGAVQVREVRLGPNDVTRLGQLCITTPLRTLVDVARVSETIDCQTASELGELIRLHRLRFGAVESLFSQQPSLPYRGRARQRLQPIFATAGTALPIGSHRDRSGYDPPTSRTTRAGQPPLTR